MLYKAYLLAAVLLPGFAFGYSEYTQDGVPSAREEGIRWYVNRMRYSPASENARLGTAYAIVPGLPPLAPNVDILRAAERHSEDLAKTDTFAHTTPAGSLYYTEGWSPGHRMTAEGFIWNSYGENIAAGNSTISDTYEQWWNSEGHRKIMLDWTYDSIECGVGYYYWFSSSYWFYWTYDVGRRGTYHFFTGTLFDDSNGSRSYTSGEGIGGLEIWLKTNGSWHSYFDESEACGSFAIPIQGIPDGQRVDVYLVNNSLVSRTLTIPTGFNSFRTVSVPYSPSGIRIGYFNQPSGQKSVGFRNLVQPSGTLWSGASDLGGGWKWLDWFGYFNDGSYPWISHAEHGWMYSVSASTDDIWFFTQDMGWLWTRQSVYPYMYRSGDGAWLWYLKGSDNPRWFLNLDTMLWETH